MTKLAFFVSGRGSNLRAVFNKIEQNEINADISAVVSNKIDSPAFEFAKEHGIKTYAVSTKDKEGFCSYGFIIDKFEKLEIDLIVLAGFLKKIPDDLVDKFENRIINIHPALLPAFGGKGMYGLNVHKAVFDSSAKVSGATVHFVNKVYDEGKIIDQRCVDISDVASPEEIAGRVLNVEHELLPSVIKKFCENKIKIIENRVLVK